MELAELKTFVTVVADHSFSLAAIDRRAKHPTLTQAGGMSR
jgi:DNA-binding transcriptional LysR family regulator